MYHHFGEWLKREGHDWTWLTDEDLCRLSVTYFNASRNDPDTEPGRRFDRLILPGEKK